MIKMSEIKKITHEEAQKIIDTRLPLGKFYTVDNGIYTGVDNSDGDAWVEDFSSLNTCKRWLEKG